jgi:hypothetical protein
MTDTSTMPDPIFDDVASWVEAHFVPMYRRTLGGEFRWCAQWWRHAEALSRFTALWYAWEAMRLQGSTGMGLWYRDHLDHQLPILLGANGPFHLCCEAEHVMPNPVLVEPMPPGTWRYPLVPAHSAADAHSGQVQA